MYISASAPDAPPLSETTIGCFIRLFFWMAACIMRAIWSEAPPAPAATTISTGLVGSQAASAGALAMMAVKTAVAFSICPTSFIPSHLGPRKQDLTRCIILRAKHHQFKLHRNRLPITFALDEVLTQFGEIICRAFRLHACRCTRLMLMGAIGRSRCNEKYSDGRRRGLGSDARRVRQRTGAQRGDRPSGTCRTAGRAGPARRGRPTRATGSPRP